MPLLDAIHGLLGAIGVVGLLLGLLLGFNTGRKLAARKHDAELARRYGRSLPGLGLILYIYMMLVFVVNVVSVVFLQLLSGEARFLLAAVTGRLGSFLAGVVVSVASIAAGYVVFSRRYRGREEPLTREGRLALRGVELAGRLRRNVRR